MKPPCVIFHVRWETVHLLKVHKITKECLIPPCTLFPLKTQMISKFGWLMGSKGSNIMKMFHSTESSPGKESQYEKSFQKYINIETKKPNKIKECGDNHQMVNKNLFFFYESYSNMKESLLQYKYFRRVNEAQIVYSLNGQKSASTKNDLK